MNHVISVQNLSKRYRLGLKEKQSDTLLGQFGQVIRSPWENLQKLRKLNRFGEEEESVFWALKDVSFDVKEGEVLGIIGKNGAGKSTLLKILSQITEPTSGKIEIHGRVASLLEVGTGFHPELSGRENIYLNGTILGMTSREIDSKLDEIIDFSGVEKFIDTPVKFYSSGMKVRLGFSVAAHLDPEILIIDEVLAVGDYEFQKKCLGKMEDVTRNQGRTVIFVSHQMDAVRKLCKKALLLEKGYVTSTGMVSEVIPTYLGKGNSSIVRGANYKYFSKVELNFELLKVGIFELLVSVKSETILKKPILGFILYNQLGTPVFGSNPKFHSDQFQYVSFFSATAKARIERVRLHSGSYQISLWLHNGLTLLEYVEYAIQFDYISPSIYFDMPDPLFIGAYDPEVKWDYTNVEK